jgi:hypothetical protein
MEYKLGKLQQQLDDLESKLYSTQSYQLREQTLRDIDLKQGEIDKLTDVVEKSKKYEREKRFQKHDSNRYTNPSLNISVTVYVDGAKVDLDKGETVRFDKKGELVVTQKVELNERRIDELKAEVYDTQEKLDDLVDDMTSNYEDPDSTSAVQEEANFVYLKSRLKSAKENLKKEKFTFDPLFYVPLAKLTHRDSAARAFVEDYMGSGRAITNVETNIDILLALLFKQKKTIVLEGQTLYIVNYSWRKREYAPYGYQVGRGKVDLRLLDEDLNDLSLREFGLTYLDEEEDEDDEDEEEEEGEDEEEEEDEEEKKEADDEGDEKELNLDILFQKIKENEEIIENVYLELTPEIRGGGLFTDFAQSIGQIAKDTERDVSTTANAVQAFSGQTLNITENVLKMTETHPNKALLKAAASYGASIDRTSHSVMRVPASMYPSSSHMYQAYMYDYLAYRFSVYHSWFKPNGWTFYSMLPFSGTEKKNSALLAAMLPYSPNLEIRKATVELLRLWNKYECYDEQRECELKYKTQIMYLKRMKLELSRRVFMFQHAFNFAMLDAVFKKLAKCSKKEKVVECVSDAQKIFFEKFKKTELVDLEDAEEEDDEDLPTCDKATEIDVPAIWKNGFSSVKVNGMALPVTMKFDLTDAPDVNTSNYDFAIQELQDKLKAFRDNEKVKMAVSLNHVVPDICRCMYEKMKQLQRAQNTKLMHEIKKNWIAQSKEINKVHDDIARLLEKSKCFEKMKTRFQLETEEHDETVEVDDRNVECTETLTQLQLKVSEHLTVLLQYASVEDINSVVTPWEEEYPAFYGELRALHDKYKQVFFSYNEVLASLTKQLTSMPKETNYDRVVARMDYIGDAYNNLVRLSIPLDKPPLRIPLRTKKTMNDFDKVVANMATLLDILENKTFRGIVYSANLPFEHEQEFTPEEADEQERYLKQVEKYTETTADKLRSKTEFTQAYAKLDPVYVLTQNRPTVLDFSHANYLLINAEDHLKRGLFLNAIHALYLALALPVKVYTDNGVEGLLFYKTVVRFLSRVLQYVGTSPALLQVMHEPNEMNRLKILVRLFGTTSDKRLPNMVRQELNQYRNEHETLAKFIANQFDHVDRSDKTLYVECLVNHICLLFYLGEMPTRKALKYPNAMRRENLAKILRFFPEKHVGRQIIANIRDALFHPELEETYDYVAGLLEKYVIKRRGILDDIKVPLKSKEFRRLLVPRLQSIREAERELKYIKLVADSALTERENNWPKPRSGSTYLRTESYPYVDGNYMINVAVDLVLSEHDPDDLGKLNCAQKKLMASDVLESSWS